MTKYPERAAAEHHARAQLTPTILDGPPPLGLHILTGPNATEKFPNHLQALEAQQIEPVIMTARRR